MKNLVIILLFILVVFIFGTFHYKHQYDAIVNAPLTRDTVFIKDTVEVTIPIPKEVEIIKYDTITLPSTKDSTLFPIVLPLEKKVYEDSTFRAVIRGYNPSLEQLTIYPTTTTITERKSLKTSGNGFKISPSIRCWIWCNKQKTRYMDWGIIKI